MKKTLVILGATSAIAEALALQFASLGFSIYLGGRDIEALKHVALNLACRYEIETAVDLFDSESQTSQQHFLENCFTHCDDIRGVILAAGYLGSQKKAQTDFSETHKILMINFVSPIYLLDEFAAHFESQNRGFIIAISSVAGDRGRQSNYYYGCAKGGLSLYLQGLRNRLTRSGVTVLTVKPGFVDTKMTQGLEGLFLMASPQSVAKSIIRAWRQKKDIVYVPWFWQWILRLIRLIPEKLFKHLSL